MQGSVVCVPLERGVAVAPTVLSVDTAAVELSGTGVSINVMVDVITTMELLNVLLMVISAVV